MSEQLTDEALLPCPFCGCDKIVIHYDHPDSVGPLVGGGYYISHPIWKIYPESWRCNAQPYPGYFETEAQAIAAWNRRATPADDLRALSEVFSRWSSGHGFNEDCDEDVELLDRATLSQNGGAA